MTWNPAQYHKFQQERFAPFEDLVRFIRVRAGLKAIDLGCGTGELTRRLADLLPDSDVLGLDSSDEMLEKAEAQARPGLCFEKGHIEQAKGRWDLVFSHAALQWVDDHRALIPRLISLVKPGGQLVVQMPSNHDHPSHGFVREIATQEPYASALGGWNRTSPVRSIVDYAQLLYDHGGPDVVIFEKAYPHVLENADAIAQWTSGTLLLPYFQRLPAELKDSFMEQYRRRLRALWPAGPVFYPFKRILFALTKSEGRIHG